MNNDDWMPLNRPISTSEKEYIFQIFPAIDILFDDQKQIIRFRTDNSYTVRINKVVSDYKCVASGTDFDIDGAVLNVFIFAYGNNLFYELEVTRFDTLPIRKFAVR